MANRVELLAPCGSYESFLAAVNAGADAVYLGGRQFGARAYAENFSEDELVTVIRKAHLFGVKVYLTVNTLVKEREFGGLCGYIRPLYEAGLDGVIVQDMGVFCLLRRSFPGLKLHASTQMTITGVYGAAYLKEMGCERIVPARELSLQEIREIKRKVSVEIEAFIHGAMCYCYSGQCLMSSMIGGRSGNRGRCAGPCRLPYRTGEKEGYYLSLKDMNTLEHIPELIEAGIDSFKIEGRMKKPEYVAGTVSVYRKYIDRYYERGDSPFQIEEKDRQMLSGLYIRSETGNGYYEKRNGADMLTLHRPGYSEGEPALIRELRERYVHELPDISVSVFVRCREGEPLLGEVRFWDSASETEVSLTVFGDMVERAEKRAVSGEEIRGQIIKTGGTPFSVRECIVDTGDNAFVPMSRIKALRRELLRRIYEYFGGRHTEKEACGVSADNEEETCGLSADNGEETCSVTADAEEEACGMTADAEEWIDGISADNREEAEPEKAGHETAQGGITLTVFVQTREQFETVFAGMERAAEKAAEGLREYLIVDSDLLLEDTDIQERLSAGRIHWGIKCPVILRKSDEKFLQKLRILIEEKKPEIIYSAALDVLAWLKSISYAGMTAGTASLYAWNKEAVSFWGGELDRVGIPLEFQSREIRDLCLSVRPDILEMSVYGRTPFMVSANCIKLTAGKCDGDRQKYTQIADRLGNVFPVYTNCRHCYNIIYNYLPTSHYENLWMLLEDGIRAFCLEFTTESGREAEEVTQTFRAYFASDLTGRDNGPSAEKPDRKNPGRAAAGQKKGKIAGMETTKGRFRLGVE